MKKLMIAAAIVCAAALSHGAVVYWGVDSMVYDEAAFAPGAPAKVAAADLTGYTAYLLVASDWSSSDLAGSLDKKVSSQELGGFYDTETPIAMFSVDTDKYAVSKGIAGTTEDYYIILSDGENYVQSSLFKGVDVLENGSTKQDAVKAVFNSDTGFANGSYLSQADVQGVPEPTSGLLLLLGVAGLALKRKRA